MEIGLIVTVLVFVLFIAGYYSIKGGSANKGDRHNSGGGYHPDLKDDKKLNNDIEVE